MRINTKRLLILKAGMNSFGVSSLVAQRYYSTNVGPVLKELKKTGYIQGIKGSVQKFKTTRKGRLEVYKRMGFDPYQVKMRELKL